MTEAEALLRYIDSRRKQVKSYAARQFGVREIWKLHCRCFKSDLMANIANSVVSIPLLGPRKVVQWLEKIGFRTAEGLAPRIPSGFPTRFQRELDRAIARDFVFAEEPFPRGSELDTRFRRIVRAEIEMLSRDRAAFIDLVASLLPLGVGYLLFKSSIATTAELGRKVASLVAQKKAASDFFLGESMGAVYYGWFPAAPTQNEIYLATALTIVVFAVLGILVHVAVDPLQNRLGAHERKLHKLLDVLEMRALLEVHRRSCRK